MVLFVVLPMVAMPFLVIVLHFVVLVLVLVLLAASPDAAAGFGTAAAAAICEITTRSQGFGSIHGWCVVAVLVCHV